MKNINSKRVILQNKRYFIYTIRMVSWITIGLYAYFGFSNLKYFAEHYFLSAIFLFALWGTDYKVHYCKTSFFKRSCEVFLHVLLVFFLFFAMYIITIYI